MNTGNPFFVCWSIQNHRLLFSVFCFGVLADPYHEVQIDRFANALVFNEKRPLGDLLDHTRDLRIEGVDQTFLSDKLLC